MKKKYSRILHIIRSYNHIFCVIYKKSIKENKKNDIWRNKNLLNIFI